MTLIIFTDRVSYILSTELHVLLVTPYFILLILWSSYYLIFRDDETEW